MSDSSDLQWLYIVFALIPERLLDICIAPTNDFGQLRSWRLVAQLTYGVALLVFGI